jgi:hypothetical protein
MGQEMEGLLILACVAALSPTPHRPTHHFWRSRCRPVTESMFRARIWTNLRVTQETTKATQGFQSHIHTHAGAARRPGPAPVTSKALHARSQKRGGQKWRSHHTPSCARSWRPEFLAPMIKLGAITGSRFRPPALQNTTNLDDRRPQKGKPQASPQSFRGRVVEVTPAQLRRRGRGGSGRGAAAACCYVPPTAPPRLAAVLPPPNSLQPLAPSTKTTADRRRRRRTPGPSSERQPQRGR